MGNRWGNNNFIWRGSKITAQQVLITLHCRALIHVFSICKHWWEQSKLPPKQTCRHVPTAVCLQYRLSPGYRCERKSGSKIRHLEHLGVEIQCPSPSAGPQHIPSSPQSCCGGAGRQTEGQNCPSGSFTLRCGFSLRAHLSISMALREN